MRVTFSGKSRKGIPEEAVEEAHHERHDEGGKEAGPEHGGPLFNLAGKVGGHEVAEEGVDKDGEAVVDDERHRNREDGGKDEDGLGKKDDPHDDAEEEEGEQVEQQRGMVRGEPLEDREGDLYQQDREDGKGRREDEVLLGQAELLDVPVGELVDDGDEREKYEEEEEQMAGDRRPFPLQTGQARELLLLPPALSSGLP